MGDLSLTIPCLTLFLLELHNITTIKTKVPKYDCLKLYLTQNVIGMAPDGYQQ